jgi:hypothetical protein
MIDTGDISQEGGISRHEVWGNHASTDIDTIDLGRICGVSDRTAQPIFRASLVSTRDAVLSEVGLRG